MFVACLRKLVLPKYGFEGGPKATATRSFVSFTQFLGTFFNKHTDMEVLPTTIFYIGWFPSFTIILVGVKIIFQKEPAFFKMVVDFQGTDML